MENATWFKIEDCNTKKIMVRDELIAEVRKAGAEVEEGAKVFVFIGENEICYAIDTDYGFLFFENGVLFTPENVDDVVAEIASL